jgi:uridylate kinase
VIEKELAVMDQTAITLCKENKVPIIVLNIHRHGEVARALLGEKVGTIVQ